ncbi:MAG: DUF1566 domain-containing protein [bacterium]|jgi:hypothetical protein
MNRRLVLFLALGNLFLAGISAGVAWSDPRFSDNGDRTLTDRLTGLVWTRDANPAGGWKTWRQALDSVKSLNGRNYLGRNDWRLPNVNELESLANYKAGLAAWLNAQGFVDVQKDDYWTSSTYAAYAGFAWTVDMYSGIVAGRGKGDGGYVWPVRGGRSGVLTLPKTGQTACHDDSGTVIDCAGTGQDGELQAGADWPRPRFTDNGDRTMTDRLTGLVWSRGGEAPGPPACNPGTRKNGQGALDHVRCLNANRYLGRSDWRLPDRNELASLVNHGEPNNAAWLNAQGFSDVQAGGYWSSGTYIPTPWNAWGVNMHDGAVTSFARKHDLHVWPVRGGR